MIFNATFNTISAISWWSVLLVEEFYECNIITSNVQNIINVKNISDEL